MTIANVSLTDTFDSWRIKTNQLIVQSQETNDLVVLAEANSAFANIRSEEAKYIANNASANLTKIEIISAQTASNILISNTYLISLINSNLVSNVYLNAPQIILSNTLIRDNIYLYSNNRVDGYLAATPVGDVNVRAQFAFAGANQAYAQANTARDHANASFEKANTGGSISFFAYDQANTARDHANVSFVQANTARNQANTSFVKANLAYDTALTKLSNTTTTLGGSLTVSGELSLTGNLSMSTGKTIVFAPGTILNLLA